MDNLNFGHDAEVNHKLNVMHAINNTGALADGAVPSVGTFFSIDPGAEIKGNFSTGRGSHLKLKYSVLQQPRWLALHIPIGGISLASSLLVGIACKTSAAEARIIRIALRSAKQQGFVDTFFPKHVIAFSDPSAHIDFIKLSDTYDVPLNAAWRDLVLFFPTESSALSLHDLRVFIV